jgi:putative ABC transport system permease protein
MLKDLAVAARTLLKRPGYAVSVVAVLSLAIGAGTVMFSLVDAALLRPLPFERPDRLVALTGVAGPERSPRGGAFPEILDWRALNTTLDDVVIYDELSLNLRVGSEAMRVDAEMVSAEYFRLLGAAPAFGRTFLPEEDAQPDQHAVAVVSDGFWRRHLGADASAVGRVISLNDRPVSVVGVMPPGFAGISFDTDVWVPSMLVSLNSAPGVVRNRATRWLLALGRLRDGVPLERAQEDLSRVAAILAKEHPDTNTDRGVDVRPLQATLLGNSAALVTVLFAAVLLFLLVACANVAGLQLARAIARRREVAVRLALGARQWHILRQLLAEAVLLSVTAGVAGALAAAWGVGAVASLDGGVLASFVRPVVDPRALSFTLLGCATVAFVVGVLPPLAARTGNPGEALKEGARSAEPGLGSLRRPSVQKALVVAEIALAMVLLTSAGLMVRSLQRQMDVPLGFQPQGVTAARVDLPAARYPPEQRPSFVERLEERLARIPGVRGVGLAADLPFTGSSSASQMLADVHAATPEAQRRYYRHPVTPGFFDALGITIIAGRAFTRADRSGAPLVAIINESGARNIWGRVDVVGRRFFAGRTAGAPSVEIVGVAADARHRNLTTDLSAARIEPDVYFPYAQRTDQNVEIAIRTDGAPISAAVLQAAVSEIDAGLPVYQVQPLDEPIRQQTYPSRFASTLLSAFSLGALVLAALGLYGLVAYVAGLSRREIAVRLALGATQAGVTAVVLRNSLVLVMLGIVLGVAGAVAAGRALDAVVAQTGAIDAVTIGGVALLLVAVSSIATLLPTRRAVRLEPHAALRE